jgi:oligopeptide/dipeptide ABC transporter ATP-binding protein
MQKLLDIQNLTVTFPIGGKPYPAVDHLSFDLHRGEVLGIVGESGCGKTVSALSLLRLVDHPGKIEAGKALYFGDSETGVDLLSLKEEEMRKIRGNKISMIFQEPMTSLNPVFTVGDQIMEAIQLHQKVGKSEARDKAIEMLKKVRIPDPERRIKDYPHQMSGGMRQRVMIAMALSCQPDILIADEPSTALDVTIQAQILDLIQELIAESNMSVLLITHDLGVVAQVCDRVMVMYAGMKVEEAPVERLFAMPKHPYTIGLLQAIPSLFDEKGKQLYSIKGTVPDLAHLPQGCRFSDRCPRVMDGCHSKIPLLKYVGEGQEARCINY